MPSREHDWQRSTDYPSASALPSFLEADLDRGMRLARQAKLEWERDRHIAAELLKELDAVDTEITRWPNALALATSKPGSSGSEPIDSGSRSPKSAALWAPKEKASELDFAGPRFPSPTLWRFRHWC